MLRIAVFPAGEKSDQVYGKTCDHVPVKIHIIKKIFT